MSSGAWRGGALPWLRTLALCFGLLSVSGGAARAQEKPEAEKAAPAKASDGPVMYATFGWGGVMPSERWAPITVYITTGDKAVSGSILLEYPQDNTQTAQIAVPFAATPNRTTPVPIVAALPNLCDELSLTMFNEGGRPIRRLRYTRIAGNLTLQLPNMVDSARGLFVGVGRCSLPESIRVWNDIVGGMQVEQQAGSPRQLRTPSKDAEQGWNQAQGASVVIDELPLSWMAYDGVTALVVNPDSVGAAGRTVDPRAQEAVHTWVKSGGRLVIMADGPGDAWNRWLPPEIRGYVTLDAASTGPVPATAVSTIKRAAAAAAARARDIAAAYPPGEQPPPVQALPDAAESVTRRVLHLKEPARKAGWKIRWATETEGSQEEWSGLLAEGPVGYGHITVLGMDPAKSTEMVNARSAGAVWRQALEEAVKDWREDAAGLGRQWGYYYQSKSERASNIAVERLGDVPIVGDAVFYVIAAALLLLVALVGPIDYFVLKRMGAGQRSWMTSLLWIALACGVAYAAPKVLRAAPTRINRLSMLDKMVVPGEGGAITEIAFRSGLAGLYAGESGVARIQEPDPASWWRGQSVVNPYFMFGDFRNAKSVVPTVQAAAGGQLGSERGNPLVQLPMGLWTFRSLADASIPRDAITGAAIAGHIRETTEGYRVLVTGLPDGARVTGAALKLKGRWLTLETPEPVVEPVPPKPGTVPIYVPPRQGSPVIPSRKASIGDSEGTNWRALFEGANTSPVAPKAWNNPPPDPNQPVYWGYPGMNQGVDLRPGPLLDLAGPDRRSLAVERYIETGEWAAVYLNLSDCPVDLRLQWPADGEHTMVVRLLVPLEGEAP